MTLAPPDLVFEQRSRLLQVWIAAFLVVGFSIGWGMARTKVLTRSEVATLAKAQSIRKGISAQGDTPGIPTPRSAADAAIAVIVRGLEHDWNQDFGEAERVTEGQLRHFEFIVGNTSVTARLEFSVSSLPHAASITAALNSGKPRALWSLEHTAFQTIPQTTAGQRAFSATWRKSRP